MSAFEKLQDGPQVGIRLGRLTPEQRRQVRKINVRASLDGNDTDAPVDYQLIYYLEGDERAAAQLFVETHHERLEQIDYSKPNPIVANVDREIYDWILDALGERELEKHETVVIERRPDGPTWCVGREQFDTHPNRRYNTTKSARITEQSLQDVFEAAGTDEQITEADLRECDAVDGEVRQVLDVFRQGDFSCVPTTVDDQLAVRIVPDREATGTTPESDASRP